MHQAAKWVQNAKIPDPPSRVFPNGHDTTTNRRSTDHMARLGPRLLPPMVHLDSVDWIGLQVDWTGLDRPTKTKLLRCSPDGSSFHHRQTRPGPMMGSRARRQKTMIDHAKHKTLKQCATRQCCRQEKPLAATRPIDPAARPWLCCTNSRRPTQRSPTKQDKCLSGMVGLCFFIAVFFLSSGDITRKRGQKRCRGWAPDKTGFSHCPTAQCWSRSQFRYNTVMSLEGKTWKS